MRRLVLVASMCAGCGVFAVRPQEGARVSAPSTMTFMPRVDAEAPGESGHDRLRLEDARFLPSGDLVVVGRVEVGVGGTDLGTGPLFKDRHHSVCFLGRYAPSGKARWVRKLRDRCPKLAVSGLGGVWLAGTSFHEDLSNWTESYDDTKRTEAPRHWLKALGDDGQTVRTLPLESPAKTLLAGPGGELVAAFSVRGGQELWGLMASGRVATVIARLDPGTGAPMWKRLVEARAFEGIKRAPLFVLGPGAWTPRGELVWAGRFQGEVALGPERVLRGPGSGYVWRMSGETGETSWSHAFEALEPGGSSIDAREVVVGVGGEAYVAWIVRQSVMFGKKGAYVTGSGKSRTVVTKLTPKGSVAWVRVFQGEGDVNRPVGLVLGEDGSPVVATRVSSVRRSSEYVEIGEVLYRDIPDKETFLVRVDAGTGAASVKQRWRAKVGARDPRTRRPRVEGFVDVVGLRRGRGAVWGVADVAGEVKLGGTTVRTPSGWTQPCGRPEGVDRDPQDCVHLWAVRAGVIRQVE